MNPFQKFFYILTWFAIWPFFKFFTRFKINLPPDFSFKKPIILVSNHVSLLDAFVIGLCFSPFSRIHPIYFMAADGLMNSPLGFMLKIWGAFPTYRGQGLEVSLKRPREILKKGNNVLIFPQGRRIDNYNVNEVKIGAAVLSLTAKTDILPIAILRKKKVFVNIGKRFSLVQIIGKKENYSQEDFQRAKEIIMEEIGKLA